MTRLQVTAAGLLAIPLIPLAYITTTNADPLHLAAATATTALAWLAWRTK